MSTEKIGSDRGHDSSVTYDSEIDLLTYHEQRAGRLIIDPAEAKIELGEAVAAKLKLSEDGTKVLWPQPTESPNDPQNWSTGQKSLQLLIVTMATIVPDFDSGTGIAALFALAEQYKTTPDHINNLTANWSIFLIGWGGLFAVMLIRLYGRLPVLFWSQLLALGFMIGATFAPNLKTFAAMRCLTAAFGTAPQVTGLYVVVDMFPFHLQARKLNIWTMGFVISPFVSPFLFGFLVARANWRWAYGVASIYGLIVVLLIAFLGKETMYDRTVKPIPEPPTGGFRVKLETLVGITGYRMAKYRISWRESAWACFKVVWRPHLFMILVFEAMVFGFSIGMNLTNAVFLGTPPPIGFGFKEISIAGAYATPIIAVFIGEFIGRYLNDWITNYTVRRNGGVFESESRLWACYLGVPLFVVGFVTLGASLENHLSIGAVVMGWGITQVAVMINTVAVYAYCNDCFPKQQGEVSALINLARTLGGFSITYYQIPWATKNGATQTFGVEAAIVAGLFLLVIPPLQLKGRDLRARYSPK